MIHNTVVQSDSSMAFKVLIPEQRFPKTYIAFENKKPLQQKGALFLEMRHSTRATKYQPSFQEKNLLLCRLAR
jgi:hypothetical protein